jgi:hypothetical protein
MGFGGGVRRLPALPNAIWFFFASPENHISLRDDLPASGNLAGIFQSPSLPAYALVPGMLALPLLVFPPIARLLRRQARAFVQQETASFVANATQWHKYRLVWEADRVALALDDETLLESSLSPRAPLGLVIWIDNQFLAWRPNGCLAYGYLETRQSSWIEIRDLHLEPV